MSEFSDEELAAAAAVGDPEAFEVLVSRLAPILLRFVRRLVDDAQTAEDLAQDTLFAAWRGLPDFGFRSTVRTWVLGIANRKVVDHYRRRREVPTTTDDFADLAAAQPLPSDEAERSALVDALRAELRKLPRTSRAVWWLREVEGLSLGEIGQVLKLSNGSVRGHLQRSRAYLTTRLAPWRPAADGAAAGSVGGTPDSPIAPADSSFRVDGPPRVTGPLGVVDGAPPPGPPSSIRASLTQASNERARGGRE